MEFDEFEAVVETALKNSPCKDQFFSAKKIENKHFYHNFLKYSPTTNAVNQQTNQQAGKDHNKDQKKSRACLWVEWDAGGQTGASCWGTEISHRVGELEKPLTALSYLMDQICPDISHRIFVQLDNLIKTGEFCDDSDYYGNSSSQGYSVLYLDGLFKLLKENQVKIYDIDLEDQTDDQPKLG